MFVNTCSPIPVLLRAAMLALLAGSFAAAKPEMEDQSDVPAAQKPDKHLPAGWGEAEMHACMAAAAPGKMHEFLSKQVGVWSGKSQMWMGPDAGEPTKGTCTWTVASLMEGRYIKTDMAGELPSLGAFTGFGIAGFDNVSQKFVGSWIDNHSTGIMQGVGELSKDGKRLEWTYVFNCPITKKQTTVRQVDLYPDANAMSFDMFTTDPKSGREYKCMHIDFTRTH